MRKLIKNDATKKGEESKVSGEDLEKLSTVSSRIQTPKMLTTVVQMLQTQTETTEKLKSILEEEEDKEKKTLSDADSDIGSLMGEMENYIPLPTSKNTDEKLDNDNDNDNDNNV